MSGNQLPKEAPKFVVSLVVVDGWPPICLSHVGIGTFLQGPYNPLLRHHVESLNQKPDGRAFLLTQLVDIPASFDQNRSNPDKLVGQKQVLGVRVDGSPDQRVDQGQSC